MISLFSPKNQKTPQHQQLTDLQQWNNIPQISTQTYDALLQDHLTNLSVGLDSNLQNSLNSGKRTQYKIKFNFSPSLGTLQEFLQEKQNKRALYTSKKKRTQLTEEQAKLEKIISKNNLEKELLLSQVSSPKQKQIASKVCVQRLFQSAYNCSLNSLQLQQKDKNEKKYKKLNIAELQKVLEEKIQNEGKSLFKLKRGPKTQGNVELGQYKKKKTVCVQYDDERRKRLLIESKNRYYDLKCIQIPVQLQQFQELVEIHNSFSFQKKFIAERRKFQARSSALLISARNSLLQGSSFLLITEPPMQKFQRYNKLNPQFCRKNFISAETVVKITSEQIILRKFSLLNLGLGLYIANSFRLEQIKVIKLQSLKISQSLLFFFLDLLSQLAPKTAIVQQISVNFIEIENLSRFCEKVNNLLAEIRVKKICLNNLDLNSKQFGKLCLGFSENTYLEEVQLRDNNIDLMGIKSLQMLLKIAPSLSKVDMRGNQLCNSVSVKLLKDKVIF